MYSDVAYFSRWVDAAREWCAEACGAYPTRVSIECWQALYESGKSPQEAGAIVGKLIT